MRTRPRRMAIDRLVRDIESAGGQTVEFAPRALP